MTSALITGITGQDGAYLAKLLLEKDYEVSGLYRRISTPNFWRLKYLEVFDEVNLVCADLTDFPSLLSTFQEIKPDEVYNLAAQSFVGASFKQPIVTSDVNALGTLRLLEVIRNTNLETKFYHAATSELFGNGSRSRLNESSTFAPTSPYAVSKLFSYWTTRNYRQAYGLFACSGILFNHESPVRGLEFVTRKVTNGAAKIKLGLQDKLSIGNLNASRDWGYAPEYVEAMYRMMNTDEPDDFVIATGEEHSVRELVETAFKHVGLDWKDHVEVDQNLLRPADVLSLCGDSTKAAEKMGWKAKTKFKQLVKLMVDEDLRRWKSHLNGEPVYWDAITN